MLIVTAFLPEKKHFKPIGSTERWAYIFQGISTPKLKIYSPTSNPWGMGEWSINIRESKGKSDKSEFTNRIDFLLFSPNPEQKGTRAKFIWEVDKGIAHSNQPTIRFYAIPFTNSQGEIMNLMLSIVENN